MSDDRTRVDVLGVGFDEITAGQAVAQSCGIMESGEKAYVVTPNPEIVWMARRDEALKAALNNARIVLPDGIGIILGARILGTPLRGGRVPGIDFAAALLEKMAEYGGRVFLLGSKPGVAEEAGSKLSESYPGLIIAGVSDGYFTDAGTVVENINAVKPDFLLVCLGAPKQELWIAENLDSLDVSLCAGLGGALDVFAGRVRRAPAVFRKLGLEWLYRIILEPRRIKRALKLPLFVLAVIRKRASGGSARRRKPDAGSQESEVG